MQSNKLFLSSLAFALLSACGGNSGNAPANSAGDGPVVTGGVVKGPVLGSTVCAYAISGGTKGASIPLSLAAGATGSINAGCYVTGADGNYAFALPAGTTDDVLLEATGGSFCTNETPIENDACPGGGTVVNLGTAVMSSVVAVSASGTTSVYTTPLTTAAVTAAGTSLTAASFNTQFNTLASQLIGQGTTVTPATQPTAGNQSYLTQVGTYLQGGGSLSTAVSTLRQGTVTFPKPTTSATISAALAGTRTLTFDTDGGEGCGTKCSYVNGQTYSVTVHADGRLDIPGKTLTNPFYRNYGAGPHTPEAIWRDSDTNIEYALSNNSTGVFNEINVGDGARMTSQGYPTLLGQLRAPAANGNAALAALAGTYTKAYQYKGADVPWTSVTIGTDGTITFNGGSGPSITSSNIVEIFDRTGCCGRIDVQVNIDLNGNGLNSQDKFSLHKDSLGALRSIEYDPGTVTRDDVGVRLGTVAPLPSHDGTSIPPTNAINGTLGGTAFNFAISSVSGTSTTSFVVEAKNGAEAIPAQWTIRVQPGATIQAGTTYDCRYTPTSSVYISIRKAPSVNQVHTYNSGRCSITVTDFAIAGTVVSNLRGTFVAEISEGNQSSAPSTVVNGVFRYAP